MDLEDNQELVDSSIDSSVVGLSGLVIEGDFLKKINFLDSEDSASEKIIFKVHLDSIRSVELKRKFSWWNLLSSIILIALSYVFWNYVETDWLKWLLLIVSGVFATSFLMALKEKYLRVLVKNADYKINFEAHEEPDDVDNFFQYLKSQIRREN